MALTVNILNGCRTFSLIDRLIMNNKPVRYLTYLALVQIRSRSCQDEDLSTATKELNKTPSNFWHFLNRKLIVSVQGIKIDCNKADGVLILNSRLCLISFLGVIPVSLPKSPKFM